MEQIINNLLQSEPKRRMTAGQVFQVFNDGEILPPGVIAAGTGGGAVAPPEVVLTDASLVEETGDFEPMAQLAYNSDWEGLKRALKDRNRNPSNEVEYFAGEDVAPAHPLYYASLNKCHLPLMVDLLAKEIGDPEKKLALRWSDNDGLTALHVAAKNGHHGQVAFLGNAMKTHDVFGELSGYVVTKKKETPLHLAVSEARLDAVRELSTLEMDPHNMNINRKTEKELAEELATVEPQDVRAEIFKHLAEHWEDAF
jgi:hypothetical protein